ncbi:MAG: sodium-dependent bicarbonate transport family permease [Candidatus Omnitrophica bacterium]|nr:sodium-dependent bicarbonate transport family permease [Candidatus Omnitrophota bacterium]
MDNLLNPVVLFFVFGFMAGVLRSDLKIPQALYDTLSIYLLLSIGMKGGVELSKTPMSSIWLPVIGAISLGVAIPVIAYGILRKLGRFNRPDSAALAAHYGSVSAVTYAVCLAYLQKAGIAFEGFSAVLLVVMEVPAIVIGIMIARWRISREKIQWGKFLREILLGKSIILLMGGLVIAAAAGATRMDAVKNVFFDPFKGLLAFFLLEMGLVAASRIQDLKKSGFALVLFALTMPLISAVLGCIVAKFCGLSMGGAVILSTLAASASYIAAPAAVRIAIPEANPALYLTASLGLTFPFNIVFGIPIYLNLARAIY